MKISLRQFDYTIENFMSEKYHNMLMQTIVNR